MTIYKIDCIFVIPDCRFLYKNRCKTKFVTFLTETEALLTSHFPPWNANHPQLWAGQGSKIRNDVVFFSITNSVIAQIICLNFVQVILLLVFAIAILVQNYFVCKLSHLFHTYVIGCVPSRLRFHRYQTFKQHLASILARS